MQAGPRELSAFSSPCLPAPAPVPCSFPFLLPASPTSLPCRQMPLKPPSLLFTILTSFLPLLSHYHCLIQEDSERINAKSLKTVPVQKGK